MIATCRHALAVAAAGIATSALPADIVLTPPPAGGVAVTNATGTATRFRVADDGTITLPGVAAVPGTATGLCVEIATGKVGTCDIFLNNSTVPCDAPRAGSLRWNAAIATLQLCDGVAWRSVSVGPQTFTVGGAVSGLVGTLVLQNNGTPITLNSNGSFTFPNPIAVGGAYAVSVLSQPTGQICVVTNGSGTLPASNVTNVSVACSTPAPLLWYRFEGDGSNIGSLPGYALALVNPQFGAGKSGQALGFGAGGYSQVSGMRSAIGSAPQVTIAFWMNVTTPASSPIFVSVQNRTVAPYGGVQLYQSSAAISGLCASSTTNSFLSGSCQSFASPSTNAWHHWIIRYAGTGTGTGQGAGVDIYVDGVLVLSLPNDANNNPVFNATGMPDTMYLGGPGAIIDEVKIFNRVFTPAEQCTFVIGGTWNGASCALP